MTGLGLLGQQRAGLPGMWAREQESGEVALNRVGIWLCSCLNARLEVGTDCHFDLGGVWALYI